MATGTGSGKTECFLFPVLEHCRQARLRGERGIKAIILYPMNALATDQASRFAKEILKTPALAGLRAGLYVGEAPALESDTVEMLPDGSYSLITNRHVLRDNPPDILLTNYKMLDFLLMRAVDASLWSQQKPDTLRYLVVDELHTFDGAQGTDLACLIRRLKGRLDTPPGQLLCVGTSATLGDDGMDSLLAFAGDVFGEALDQDAVIREDRISVGDYLADALVEHMQSPQATDASALDPALYSRANDYLAAQVNLWFGEAVSAQQVGDFAWRCVLGEKLKSHFAFQNLLRDLDKLGARSVPIAELIQLLMRRLPQRDNSSFVLLWLSSLLALVAHARKPGHQDFFLQVKVEIWLRELRRMVALLGDTPVLRHHDGLGKAEKADVYLPVINCRDCHTTGWGATLPKTSPNQLQADLQSFYTAFFAEDVSTRFVFPASEKADPRFFEFKKVCSQCATLHQGGHKNGPSACSHCGHEPLLAVSITANLRDVVRNGASFTKSHHGCPFCGGHNTLSIVGSQAASLASVMVAQLYGSRFNHDRKLIDFSDSVQDAAHRAGFFAARTWRLNLRPALAQTIAANAERDPPLTLADLPAAFAQQWQTKFGTDKYIANFLPPQLNWLRDVETLMHEGKLPENSNVPREMNEILPWIIQAEFGQDAHVGRTLVATRTASVAPMPLRWQQALEWLEARLGEEFDVLKGTSSAAINSFLRGLVDELQRMGAWRHAGLSYYAQQGCRSFVYKKNPSKFKLLAGPRPPRYLSLPEFQRCVSVEKDASGLFRAWAYKSLPALNSVALGGSAVVHGIYQLALNALREAGLADAEESQDARPTQVWGLNPAAFTVQLEGKHWQCKVCSHKVTAAPNIDLSDEPCRRLNCAGQLQAGAETDDFYRKLYLTAEIQRVVAHEHTGLLPRETREWVERDFKSNEHRAGSINLLSATPTLEMGIDIGDLSSTMLCSVPPKQANYLQRAGRAGRSTGNALLMTLAVSRPHDWYFWETPREMLAGSVNAPGVFLNASAVLERQLTAFTLDCWVRETGKAAQIPGEIRAVFNAIRSNASNRFPYPWLSHVDQQRGALLDKFIHLFNQAGHNPLSEETKVWLSRFINGNQDEPGSLSWKIIDKLNGIAKDVDEFKRQRDKTDKEISKLKETPVLGEEDAADLMRLEQERAALARLIGSIESKATLNVLTDEGLLPNYSFPEQGVLLRSIILREKKPGSDSSASEPLTFEYERPGSSAITELAPNNTFYAEGRRVIIDQVDVSKIKPEPWRFCRQCAYAEPIATGDNHEQCPRCSDGMWSDSGRVHEMLKLTTVFARTLDRDSRIADDSDERQRGFYLRQALVDSPPESVRLAFAIDKPDFPFAFEFLDKVTFREINFGEMDPNAVPMVIAGEEKGRPGFSICPECGTLQRKRKAEELFRNHAPWCARRKSEQAASQQCIFLYREFVSEGIRLYLPEAAGEVQERLLSFVAALQLGLTRRFRGAVDHLRIALDMRMSAGLEQPRCYLVIYDSVPGGTGYLKELMRDQQPLFEVLQAALDALNACVCNQDAEKDGCYHCVYAYQNSYDRKHVSRSIAQQLLTEALEHQAALKPVSGLAAVQPTNQLFDSELEKRFVEALRREHAGVRFELSEILTKGKPGYQVQAGSRRWRLEPQVKLSESDGVLISSQPDFVFWPDDGETDLPVAIFLDGWQYHKKSIEQDLSKRLAIAKSGKFSVWTLTWPDIDAVMKGKVDGVPSPWPVVLDSQSNNVLAPLLAVLGISQLQSLKSLTPFMQLHQRLANHRHEHMQRLASALAVGLMMPPGEPSWLEKAKTHPFWIQLNDLGLLPPNYESYRMGARRLGSQLLWSAGISASQLAELMKNNWQLDHQPMLVCLWDDAAETPDQERQSRWQQLWQTLNLLFPLRYCWAGGRDMQGLRRLQEAPVFRPEAHYNTAWLEVADSVGSEVQHLVAELAQTSFPIPMLGYGLMDAKGCIVAEAEMAWESDRIAVLLAQDTNFEQFIAAGWKCLVATEETPPDALFELLREKNQ